MFRRLVLEDHAAIFTIVAFAVAAAIFLLTAWRALRMPREQTDRFSRLPFHPDSVSSRHDHTA